MTTVHRLLDEAFAGVVPTPEVLDLKEEIRANLTARAAELESAGAPPDVAARRAVDELGDVRALVADAQADALADAGADPHADGTGAAPADTRSPMQRAAAAALHQRVRPRPGFVVGVVLASVVAAGALALAALGATGVTAVGAPLVLAAVAVTAAAGGWIVGTALAQETTTNHPLPGARAAGYGLGAGLAVAGAGLAGAVALLPLAAGWYVAAAVALVAGVLVLVRLGATQTNRKKAWVRDVARAQAAGEPDRFTQDPAAAARFGIYTVVIWLTAFVAFVVLGLTVGWAWSWLTFVAAFAVMMLVLARMLFGPSGERHQ